MLGIYSYFLSVLADRHLNITRDQKAIEGLSGVAVIYTIFAVVLTCFLGGVRFFAFLAIVLNVAFCGAFIALAVLTRDGSTCGANPTTPLGTGPSDSKEGFGGPDSTNGNITYSVTYGTACRLNTACFAVSIIGAILFLISAVVQIWVSRHHQKEKKYGPSPANNYTSGSAKRKFWQRKPKNKGFANDTELATGAGAGVAGAGLAAPAAHDNRVSHETGYTNTESSTKYDHAGYNTAPTGTAVQNPYGHTSGPTNSPPYAAGYNAGYTNAAPINPNYPAGHTSATNY